MGSSEDRVHVACGCMVILDDHKKYFCINCARYVHVEDTETVEVVSVADWEDSND